MSTILSVKNVCNPQCLDECYQQLILPLLCVLPILYAYTMLMFYVTWKYYRDKHSKSSSESTSDSDSDNSILKRAVKLYPESESESDSYPEQVFESDTDPELEGFLGSHARARSSSRGSSSSALADRPSSALADRPSSALADRPTAQEFNALLRKLKADARNPPNGS
jgi:hypothetical protein